MKLSDLKSSNPVSIVSSPTPEVVSTQSEEGLPLLRLHDLPVAPIFATRKKGQLRKTVLVEDETSGLVYYMEQAEDGTFQMIRD